MTVEETIPFRDKEIMKKRLDEAGIRTPRHASVTTVDGCRKAAAAIGFPERSVVVKPIAGAGSTDSYHVRSADELEAVLALQGKTVSSKVSTTVDTSCPPGCGQASPHPATAARVEKMTKTRITTSPIRK